MKQVMNYIEKCDMLAGIVGAGTIDIRSGRKNFKLQYAMMFTVPTLSFQLFQVAHRPQPP